MLVLTDPLAWPLPRGEELLSAAVLLQGPRLLAETWPSLVVVKGEEVVKVSCLHRRSGQMSKEFLGAFAFLHPFDILQNFKVFL